MPLIQCWAVVGIPKIELLLAVFLMVPAGLMLKLELVSFLRLIK